ncbi:hypothetical protein BU14_0143s0010 [Porphyra umbilicalis]|uniref:Uncharacterized protein n=1 Tax=Porphyra umbilicalis TaxID=2786 RepID=A0A1X6P9P2_PORUM|nr:hypothetical protein BU14_0143s0010 [Porphyra umbilicalis]|eukprot:OSX77574.1 hypothetical protein BU14_0143s0010 [Porphyra umbilicalis]
MPTHKRDYRAVARAGNKSKTLTAEQSQSKSRPSPPPPTWCAPATSSPPSTGCPSRRRRRSPPPAAGPRASAPTTPCRASRWGTRCARPSSATGCRRWCPTRSRWCGRRPWCRRRATARGPST